jgi:hypothetical protein
LYILGVAWYYGLIKAHEKKKKTKESGIEVP